MTGRTWFASLALGLLASLSLTAGASGQSWKTVTMSRQLSGEEQLDVEVTYGAGRFVVRPTDEDLLYSMKLHYDEDVFEPIAEFDGLHLQLGVDNVGHDIHVGKGRSEGEMTLSLTRDVPMDLTLEFGAVRAELDLGGLELTGLDVSTGASESTLDVSEPNRQRIRRVGLEIGAADFTAHNLGNLNADEIDVDAGVGKVSLGLDGDWQRDATVTIDMGLGKLELRVPEGLGIRLTKESFLTALDSEGLVKRGDSYYSLDWEEARRKVGIDLDAAFGSVEVVWVR